MSLNGRAIAIALMGASPSSGTPVVHENDGADSINQIFTLDGGRRIAVHCAGRGRFTVLLEPGDGGHRAHMAALFAALSARYRVCDYDRRNVGQSSSAALPRKAADLITDAFDALAAAGVRGPLILFGSSMGGLLVRSYAASHRVVGYVTSNQPCTTREWTWRADRVMSAAERKIDREWMAGDNNEHIDVNDLSRTIDRVPPPSFPHIIMISTESAQCKTAGICGPMYRAFVGASREAARSGRRGQLRRLDGAHDLYLTHLADVVRAIDDVAAAATARAS